MKVHGHGHFVIIFNHLYGLNSHDTSISVTNLRIKSGTLDI